MQLPLTSLKTPGYRRRQLAKVILARHSIKPAAAIHPDPIRVVCVSDTHNKQPDLPPGDILIHAGDLTENGSFDEVQAGLTWLSSQPHPFKFLIAGNHDVLLDEAFLQRYPERRYGSSKTKEDLDWGSVIYLEDSSITLDVPVQQPATTMTTSTTTAPQPITVTRKVTIYGSPWTPQYGISAFQYPPSTGETHWSERLYHLHLPAASPPSPSSGPRAEAAPPSNTNIFPNTNTNTDLILVTHGPPKLYLDRRDIHNAGCPYLLSHISDLRSRLHVFGHIHVAHGRQDVVLDPVRQAHDLVQIGWGGWDTLAWMATSVLWAKVKGLFVKESKRTTTFVNASVVGGRGNELVNRPIVVEI